MVNIDIWFYQSHLKSVEYYTHDQMNPTKIVLRFTEHLKLIIQVFYLKIHIFFELEPMDSTMKYKRAKTL